MRVSYNMSEMLHVLSFENLRRKLYEILGFPSFKIGLSCDACCTEIPGDKLFVKIDGNLYNRIPSSSKTIKCTPSKNI
ncbi:hypothetical protein BpHYR1_029068 [Brachionus plicatilis]|uniref:Uncharacterized protein n=1 Tax=Brachionus plicatilis TaxID=10195 RepID=A0A3M7Q9U8_BRAPC|nr:hypothetical protein BpHYR1_029068 [Brachionus plicatilis]